LTWQLAPAIQGLVLKLQNQLLQAEAELWRIDVYCGVLWIALVDCGFEISIVPAMPTFSHGV
jgi:hypothetical protein